MMSDVKGLKLFQEGHPVSKFLLDWCENLKNNKGDRAELRRCKNLSEIQMTSAYQRCYWKLIEYFSQEPVFPSKEQIAIVIGLAAHIEDNDNEKKSDQRENQTHDYFGYQISRGDKPKISELRFRRLLKIKNREKLYHFLIQIIRILEKEVNVMDLLSIAYFWGDTVKKNLAYKYYEKATLD